ncbi:MAG: anti-sigma factor antagonist [Firmicutes bacterium]|nr:anti-sigma factor antagonist [Bacillota bacterium]
METTIYTKGSWLIVRLKGELDVATVPAARAKVEQALQRQTITGLLVDLTNVMFMDSSGLGFLLGRYRRLVENKGTMIVVGAQGQVRRVLELSGLTRIIPQKPTLAEAMVVMGEGK